MRSPRQRWRQLWGAVKAAAGPASLRDLVTAVRPGVADFDNTTRPDGAVDVDAAVFSATPLPAYVTLSPEQAKATSVRLSTIRSHLLSVRIPRP